MAAGMRGKPVAQQGNTAGGTMPPLRNRHCLSASLLLTIIMSFVVSHRLLISYLEAEPVAVEVKRLSPTEVLLLNYSSVNREIDTERGKLKDLLTRSENGRYNIREVIHLRRPPPLPLAEEMDRLSRIAAIRKRLQQNAWMVPISTRRFEPFVARFYELAEEWSAQGEFDPRVMKELPRTVKEPLDQQFGRGNNNLSREEDGYRRYRSCAVVGNSGILLNSSYGDQIDSHEMVIRLNNAKVFGFEKHVGTKTGLAFSNSNILRQCARREDCSCHPYGPDVPMMIYICQAPHLMDVALCRSYHRSALLVTDGRLDILSARIAKWYSLNNFVASTGDPIERWDKVHGGFYFHYSSGFQAVMVALGICDRVSMFGFGKDPSLKHHYHTPQKEELSLHDYQAEYIFYDDLVHNSFMHSYSELGEIAEFED
ncbi:hypothetical protein R1flu_019108 [Riccia fluitans]|uniref:Uncharacterized protein n=1 Tax=Riccia fluitans TaxID=41844 RepID=A0ABD1ZI23_9MARC